MECYISRRHNNMHCSRMKSLPLCFFTCPIYQLLHWYLFQLPNPFLVQSLFGLRINRSYYSCNQICSSLNLLIPTLSYNIGAVSAAATAISLATCLECSFFFVFSRNNMNNNEPEKLKCTKKPHRKLREIEHGSWQPQ